MNIQKRNQRKIIVVILASPVVISMSMSWVYLPQEIPRLRALLP
jgi:hypothetical protein